MSSWLGRVIEALRHVAGRLGVRLILVNLVVLLVPVAGLEFARVHERQLLDGLERDMRNQAALVRAMIEQHTPEVSLASDEVDAVLRRAAERTRTRIRVINPAGDVVMDSHAGGPPEGPERPAQSVLPSAIYELPRPSYQYPFFTAVTHRQWPEVPQRSEVRAALRGRSGAATRYRSEAPSVILFITEPVFRNATSREVLGVVYVTRSTQPVLEELYRIRRSFAKLLIVALAITLAITFLLALSITRPLARLARATRAIGPGANDEMEIPIVGTGEIREVSSALATLWRAQRARLQYITEFSADVAHELKSPLTSIRGAAELLREGGEDAATREHFLRNIELDAERLDQLVNRLLELSRIDASRTPFVMTRLDDVVRAVIERTTTDEQPVVFEGAHVELALRSEDMERAILNLVENALRHGPTGAPVVVRVEESAGVISLAVEDQGSGVPEAVRGRLFERFFTTEEKDRGTGLGLAIVRSVAEAHGGRAYLDKGFLRGARFVMELPRR
jgi:two-component system sensor histidine kinase ChvG